MPDKEKWFAPIALSLKGTNSKASIYLNGRLIGRWISDNNWLARGGWFQPIKNMWTSTTTDEFPIPNTVLKNGKNSISIAFEDTSGSLPKDAPGKIDSIKIILATEAFGCFNGNVVEKQAVHKKIILK